MKNDYIDILRKSIKLNIHILLPAIFLIFIATETKAQFINGNTVEIGTGTTTGNWAPLGGKNGYNRFAYMQTIYGADVIQRSGTIRAITYHVQAGQSVASSTYAEIYMGYAPNTLFTSTTGWIPEANLTYVGRIGNYLNIVPEWKEIPLENPFVYDKNLGNLVIAFKTGFTGWSYISTAQFYYTEVGDQVNNGAALFTGGYSESFGNYPTGPGILENDRANIKIVFQEDFVMDCGTIYTCTDPGGADEDYPVSQTTYTYTYPASECNRVVMNGFDFYCARSGNSISNYRYDVLSIYDGSRLIMSYGGPEYTYQSNNPAFATIPVSAYTTLSDTLKIVFSKNSYNTQAAGWSTQIRCTPAAAPSCPILQSPINGDTTNSRVLIWQMEPTAQEYYVYFGPESLGINNIPLIDSTTDVIYRLPVIPEGNYLWKIVPKGCAGIPVGCTPTKFVYQYSSMSDKESFPSTEGTNFYFSLMRNGYYYNGSEFVDNIYTAIISSQTDVSVTFYYHASGTSQTISVRGGEPKEVPIPKEYVYNVNPGTSNRVVHVTSTGKISLYIANEATNSFDASIVLPLKALGSEYMVQTYPNSTYTDGRTYSSPCFLIIATKDETHITIGNNINGASFSPASTSIILNKGECYFVTGNNQSGANPDLSGLTITSDPCKPIAVFNGNTLTDVPNTIANNRDHLFEQAYPIPSWGTEFAIVSSIGYKSFPDNRDADYIRVTASEASTRVYMNRTYQTTLNKGETWEYMLPRSAGSCFIQSSKPVACYLYQRSASQFGFSDNIGDPSMVWISPVERGINEITFSTFSATGIPADQHYLNITVPTDSVSGMHLIDESTNTYQNISRNFLPLAGNPNISYARIQINAGTYTLRNTEYPETRFVAYIYGLGDVRGYAYTVGSSAIPYSIYLTIDSLVLYPNALPEKHYCINTNIDFSFSANYIIDSTFWNFKDGTTMWQYNPSRLSPFPAVQHQFATPNSYLIEGIVYATISDPTSCEDIVIRDTISYYVMPFPKTFDTIDTIICRGSYYEYANTINGHDTVFLQISTDTISNDVPYITDVHALTEYGCEQDLHFIIHFYDSLHAGAIKDTTIKVECADGLSFDIIILKNITSAWGGPPDAHYQWQRKESSLWEDIIGQEGDFMYVTVMGEYRRAYTSICGSKYTDSIFIDTLPSSGGSINPGDIIGFRDSVCSGSLYVNTIGNSAVSPDTVVINGITYPVNYQWQRSVDLMNWITIPSATGKTYSISESFTQSTYFRRLAYMSNCDASLIPSVGVVEIVVKPTFIITDTTVTQGCYNQSNVMVSFTITSGSGSYTFKINGTPTVPQKLSNVYRFIGLNHGVPYIFEIEDNVYGCKKDVSIPSVNNPNPISITLNPSSYLACQSTPLTVNATISEGTAPYKVEWRIPTLGINSVIKNNVSSTTNIQFIVPDSASGSHSVVVIATDKNNCQSQITPSNVITINPNPVFTSTVTPTTNCITPNGTITVNVNTPGVYIYQLETETPVTGKPSTYTFYNVNVGMHAISVKNQTTGCLTRKMSGQVTGPQKDTIKIRIDDSIDPDATTNVITRCPKTPIKYQIIQPLGNYTYFFKSIDNGNNPVFLDTTSSSCGYEGLVVYVQDNVTGCVTDKKIPVYVEDLIPPTIGTIDTIAVNAYFCTSNFIIPNLSDTIQKITTDNCSDVSDLAISQVPVPGSITWSTYQPIQITVADICEQYTSKNVILKQIFLSHADTITHSSPYCYGDNMVLTVANYGDDFMYVWERDGRIVQNSTSGRNKGYEYKKTNINQTDDGGIYNVIITDPLGCRIEKTANIVIYPKIELQAE